MRQTIISFICIVMLLLSPVFAHTHSGRTDKYGGHHDRKNGGYHFHNNGTVGQLPAQPVNKPANSTSQQQSATQQQAIFDAHRDAEQNVSAVNWMLVGAGCGVITFAYAAVSTPPAPPTRLIGKSPEYTYSYTGEYQSKAKNKRIKNSCLGWGAFAILYFVYLGSTIE